MNVALLTLVLSASGWAQTPMTPDSIGAGFSRARLAAACTSVRSAEWPDGLWSLTGGSLQLAGEIAVTINGVVRPITTSPTLIFFSMSCLAMVLAL